MERAAGIEPASATWKDAAQPLYQARININNLLLLPEHPVL